MVGFSSQGPDSLFNEVAIADLNQFQIAVLTKTQQTKRKVFSVWVPIPQRIYQSQGWLIYNRRVIAHFDRLEIGLVFPTDSPFKVGRRIAPGIPLAFEVSSAQPLPAQICAQAALVCQLPEADFPHRSVFRQRLPRFVKIYAYQSDESLLDKVDEMLLAMNLFISKNYDRLKKIPFYRDSFGL
ncbi:MAG: hypothetical protein AAFO83_00380 [Cyanobacteria bacterium J06607_13]